MPQPRGIFSQWFIWPLVGLAILAASMPLDRPVALAIRGSHIKQWHDKHQKLADIVKYPGDFRCTAITAAVVLVFHSRKRLLAGLFHLTTGFAGVINSVIKWIVGRTRPFQLKGVADEPAPFVFRPFRDAWPGLFHQTNLAFPSGHACISFAAATGLALLFPRLRWFWFTWATVISAERVIANAHYLSDVVGGALLGIGVVRIIWYLLERDERTRLSLPRDPGL